MKLVLKTILGKQHEVEVEPSATILDVKKLVEDEYEPASLRLCYNGAVLEDAKTVTEAGVKEGESLVLAGRKRKIPKPAAPPPAEAPKAEVPKAEAPKAEVPKAEEPSSPPTNVGPTSSAPARADAEEKPSSLADITTPAEATAAATTATNAAAATAPVPPQSFLASAAPSATSAPVAVAPAAPAINPHGAPTNLIDEVCAMGFEDRNQVALALRAAYMNVDRAVEYLFDGIPPHLVQEFTRNEPPAAPATVVPATPAAPTTSSGNASTSAPTTATAAPASSTPESELRAALRGIPQFDEIRALYAQNTDTLPVVTQQIALRHPAVYELIERNPEAFLTIMSETGGPGSAESAPSHSEAGGAAASAAHSTAEDNEGDRFMSQLHAQLDLTDEDVVAVQQLVELGGGLWDEQSAVLVYIAAQRNQELAASILFEHGGVPPELLAAMANQQAEEDEENGDE
jgi:UV excision repair protein RAD23